MIDLGLETDGSNGSTGGGPGFVDVDVKGTGIMPCETDEDGSTVLLLDDFVDGGLGSVEVFLGDGEGGDGTGGFDGGWDGECVGRGDAGEEGSRELHRELNRY